MVGNGALLYRRTLGEGARHLEFASATNAFPMAMWLLELALPRFHREETSAPHEVVPHYVRKSDAEINWAQGTRSA